jgi:hypothetical protein
MIKSAARSKPETRPKPSDAPLTERLGAALRDIAADAAKSPDRYLRDTRVPEGGE